MAEETTAVVTKPAAAPPSVRAGAPLQALIPRTIEEAYRLSVAISKSGLAPKDMRTPEQVMVAIMGGAEVGLPPFQALQSFAVVNGRPTMWGDGLLAVVRARKVKVKEWYEGQGDGLVAWCEVTRPDTDEEPVKRWFSVEDAKMARLWGKDGPWSTYPRRMLQMRARSWAIRDGCADMLRGIQIREEVTDYEEVTDLGPAPSHVAHSLALESQIEDGEIVIEEAEQQPVEPKPEPETVNVKPQPTALSPTAKWAAEMREAFEATREADDLPALTTRWSSPSNGKALARAKRDDAKLAAEVEAEYGALQERLKE